MTDCYPLDCSENAVRVGTAILAICALTSSGSAVSSHVEARLVAENTSIRAGEPFWVGLHLRMQAGWHTYWKNPGDSGLATRITWTLPEGFTAGTLVWPYPERMPSGPLMSYGYDGDVLLLVEITPPEKVSGQAVSLAARADWLECAEECLPGRANLTVSLSVGSGVPLRDTSVDSLFQESRDRLPSPASDWNVRARGAADSIALAIEPPRSLGNVVHAMYFYAEDPEILDYAAEQRLTRTDPVFLLDLSRAANASQATSLRGVLLVETRDHKARAVQLNVPLAHPR